MIVHAERIDRPGTLFMARPLKRMLGTATNIE
jgi:hypothetical protein